MNIWEIPNMTDSFILKVFRNVILLVEDCHIYKKGCVFCIYFIINSNKVLQREAQFKTKPFFYKRYIDDGFGIWTASLDSLLRFADFANNIHGDIKLELRWSKEEIVFLDTVVKIAGGQLYTDLHIKPTDKQLYIQQKSCHPTHTKKSLAYSLGLRIKRICENEEDYKRHRSELKFQLRKRGYSGGSIERQLQKVDKLDRLQLLQKDAKRQKTDRVPLVLTCTTQNLCRTLEPS